VLGALSAHMILENARSAAYALRVNKLRSSLAMLGIIIGVGSVIATVAVGAGAHARVTEQIQSLGANLIIATAGSRTSRGVRGGQGSQVTLTEDDAIAIQHQIPAVQAAAPASGHTPMQVVHRNFNWATGVLGITPETLEVKEWDIVDGRPITAEDHRVAAKVVLVGQTVAQNLFGDENPIGLSLRIRRVPFTVIGLLGLKGQNTFGQDQDDIVMVPLSTARQKLFGRIHGKVRAVWVIIVKIREGEDLDDAEAQIRELLRQRHGLQPYQDDDFTLRNPSEVLQAQEAASRVMAYLLAAIGSVSLLVGGIGIMNIMLVSVTERTREIGLRMAVGARSRDILTQFLVEAVTLSLIGGAIGIAVGLGGASAISYFAEWRTLIEAELIVLACGVAAAVGIVFGFYPAHRAARLDPMEALRYE
jgi:putative ABC transport system permease protein